MLSQSGTDIFVWGSESLESQNPSITYDGGTDILVSFEGWVDIFTSPNPYFRWSNDGGQTWLPEDSTIYYDLAGAGYDSIQPVVDFASDGRGFGTILPFDQTDWMTFNFPVITDSEANDGWVANGWVASAMMSEWDSADACGITPDQAPSPDAYGLCVWTGDTLDGTDNGLFYGWEITAGTEFVVHPGESNVEFDFEANQAKNDVDLSTGMYYQTYYIFNDASDEQLPDGVHMRGVQLDGTDSWVENWEVSYHITGAEHADVVADSGNCYIVYEINGGIGCSYSNSNGASFSDIIITNDGNNPSISAVDQNILISYTRNGNLYTATSDDGGSSWLEGDYVNDESGQAIEEPESADVAGMYAIWTDERFDYNSLFFDTTEIALPIIEIESIAGGVGVSAVITNVGTADATDVDCSITVTGGIMGLIDTEVSTVEDIPIGGEITIETGMIIGFGNVEITVTAGSASEVVTGRNLLIFTSI
jgi:hypothetical protein